MKRQIALLTSVILISCVGAECPNNNNNNNNGNSNNNNNNNNNNDSRVILNIVKLTTPSTTQRGPAVGDGVLAFNANGNATLAWLRAGETQPMDVPAPSGMDNDTSAFEFAGKKLVVRDRTSGSLYVFDTETEQVAAMPAASINMGGSGGPNLWAAEGNVVATVNSTVTTQNGAGLRVKMVDISDINNFVITPFSNNPGTSNPSAIDVDAAGRRIVVRTNDTFYVYDMDNPGNAPDEFTRSSLNGGTGDNDVQIEGATVAFFDDNESFTLLDLVGGTFSQPTRNPGRAGRGLFFEESRFAYFAKQTADDGSNISVLNRCLAGDTSDISSLIDPTGLFVNGENASDGRWGFGATADISPNGRWIFVAGETIVDVNTQERLYLSEDGGDFIPVADSSDPFNVIRAAGVSCSNNLVAFLIPVDPDAVISAVTVGYAELPPP
ncbi:MAG: hypothetical protein KF841_06310 [Phycisphaerae bacterium]|nr:hypothetical protein [Phycisphaerae bacterium]